MAAEFQQLYQDQHLTLDTVDDTESLARSLNVSASLQVHAIAGHGSAQASFTQDYKFDSKSVSVNVQALVLNGPRFLVPVGPDHKPIPPTDLASLSLLKNATIRQFDINGNSPSSAVIDLSPDMAKLAKKNPTAFFKTCGDSFVTVILEGARIDSVLQFLNVKSQEATDLRVAIEGGGIGWDAKGAFASSMKTYSDNSRLHLVYDRGGGYGGTLATDQASLLDAVVHLPDTAKNNPKPYSIVVQRYDTLPSWPTAPIGQDLEPQQVLANKYYRLRALYRLVDDWLVRSGNGYLWGNDLSDSSIKSTQDLILKDMKVLEAEARACANAICKPNFSKLSFQDDYTYRTRLPMPFGRDTWEKGSYPDWRVQPLEYGGIAYQVGFQRYNYYILKSSIARCAATNECLTNSERDSYRSDIFTPIYDTFPDPVKAQWKPLFHK